MFRVDGFRWAAAATSDDAFSVLHHVRVRSGVAVGSDGRRLHSAADVPLRDGLYDRERAVPVAEPRPFPDVDRIAAIAFAQPQVADWSAYGALTAADAAAGRAPDARVRMLGAAGPVDCSARFLRDALWGLVAVEHDARVTVQAGGLANPVGLRGGGRFAVVMPTVDSGAMPPAVDFLPQGSWAPLAACPSCGAGGGLFPGMACRACGRVPVL